MKICLFPFLILLSIDIFSQCPQFYDFDGQLTDTPQWISCDGNNYMLSLLSNSNIGNFYIDWGNDTYYLEDFVTPQHHLTQTQFIITTMMALILFC